VIFFVVPPGESVQAQEAFRKAIDRIGAALHARGIAGRMSETPLSLEDAQSRDDIADMVPDGAEAVTLVEIFVPTHQYWSAINIPSTVIESMS
jgi:hypothetical protein